MSGIEGYEYFPDTREMTHEEMMELIKILISENKRYREILQYYGELPCIQDSQVGWNVGYVARQALYNNQDNGYPQVEAVDPYPGDIYERRLKGDRKSPMGTSEKD